MKSGDVARAATGSARSLWLPLRRRSRTSLHRRRPFLLNRRTPPRSLGRTVVIGRELLITGLRGIMETQGVKFGADWLGKLKTTLQCVTIVVILIALWQPPSWFISIVQTVMIYAMIVVTVASGAQYIIKAIRVWKG